MAVELRVHVQPRASRSAIVGWREESGQDELALPVLAVRLTAPPVEGAANRACRDFLAEVLGVKRVQVTLLSGERSREKRFRVEGISLEELRRRANAAMG
jgi:uncharacterized protein (TIGR00251 family)